MRFGSVLFGTALVMTLAAPAAAQGTSTPKAFVGGLVGVTFGTATSSAIAGQVGVRISGDLFVIGEIGRMQDVTPGEIADLIQEGIDQLEDLDIPVDVDFKVPAFYGFGGIRWAQSSRRVAPFVEAGAGFARLTSDVSGTIAGIDVTEYLEDVIGDTANFSTNEFLLAFGGGANISLTPAVSVDAGYRFTRIFTDDPAVNTSMVYGAVKILFGR